jgi:NADH-quinone oxidoreductase subunit E
MIDKSENGIEAILARHPAAGRAALIPVLQEIQDSQGYISREAIGLVGQRLGLPASKIFGVATFYNQFRFAMKGKYHFTICRGTACHVKGSEKVLDMVMRQLKLKPGQTSRDKLFSLEIVACMGACGLAPVVNVNGEFYAKVTPARLGRIIQDCRQKEVANGKQ